MRKAVSREIGRSQKDPAERFDWVDVYLMVGSSVLGAGRIYYYLLGGKTYPSYDHDYVEARLLGGDGFEGRSEKSDEHSTLSKRKTLDKYPLFIVHVMLPPTTTCPAPMVAGHKSTLESKAQYLLRHRYISFRPQRFDPPSVPFT